MNPHAPKQVCVVNSDLKAGHKKQRYFSSRLARRCHFSAKRWPSQPNLLHLTRCGHTHTCKDTCCSCRCCSHPLLKSGNHTSRLAASVNRVRSQHIMTAIGTLDTWQRQHQNTHTHTNRHALQMYKELAAHAAHKPPKQHTGAVLLFMCCLCRSSIA